LASEVTSPEVYNSLAWEFALRQKYPEETLEAALKAHALAPKDANIMDTVAEAYYAAGDYKTALDWETRALEIDPENDFFQKQLKKFQEAHTQE
jgi:tetratricopeptide (TPR) repeat protein